MRKRSLALAILMVAMVAFPCSAFADEVTAESLVSDFVNSSKDVSEFSGTLQVGLEMGISYEEESMTTSVNAEFALETKQPVMHMTGKMAVEVVPAEEGDNEEMSMELYAVTDEAQNQITMYSNTEGVWEKSVTDYTASPDFSAMVQDLFGKDLVLADDTVDVDGIACYKVTGKVSLADAMNALSSVSDSATDVMPMDLGDMQNMSFNAEYLFNADTHGLYSLTLDGADSFKDAYMSILREQLGDAADAFGFEIPAFFVKLSNVSYGPIDDIVVPEDVIASAIDASTDAADNDEGNDDDADFFSSEEYPGTLAETFEWKPEYESISINGADVVLRQTTVGEFVEATGLVLGEEYASGYMVNAGQTDSIFLGVETDSYDPSFYLSVKNTGSEAADVKDCLIYSVAASGFESIPDASIAGVKFDKSLTEKDIVDTFGDPTSYYGSDYYTSYTYASDAYEYLEFDFNPAANGALTEIRVYVYE